MIFVSRDARPNDVARRADARANSERIAELKRTYDPSGELRRLHQRLDGRIAKTKASASIRSTARANKVKPWTSYAEFDRDWEHQFRGIQAVAAKARRLRRR